MYGHQVHEEEDYPQGGKLDYKYLHKAVIIH